MPNHLLLELTSKTVRPGETVTGEILWEFDSRPESIYLSLGWWTSGRGDRDEFVVADHEWKAPPSIGKESFSLAVPDSVIPSFSGRLISVEWGVQVSVKGVKIDDLIETLTVSPTNREIDISADTYESQEKSVSIGKGRGLSLSNRR